MEIKSAKSTGKNHEVEYYFLGLENFDYFDFLLNLLKEKFNAEVLEVIDGIYSRIGKIKVKGINLKLIWHEDVGLYLTEYEKDESILDVYNSLVEEILFEVNRLLKYSGEK